MSPTVTLTPELLDALSALATKELTDEGVRCAVSPIVLADLIAAARAALAPSQPAESPWEAVSDRPLEPGDTRLMAVEILRNGVPDWDLFIATVSEEYENEWNSDIEDPGWEPSDVSYSMYIGGLPKLPKPEPTNGR